MIENLTDTVIEIDSLGNYTYLSPQFFDLSGYKPEEIIGKNGFEFIHPDDIEGAMNALAK